MKVLTLRAAKQDAEGKLVVQRYATFEILTVGGQSGVDRVPGVVNGDGVEQNPITANIAGLAKVGAPDGDYDVLKTNPDGSTEREMVTWFDERAARDVVVDARDETLQAQSDVADMAVQVEANAARAEAAADAAEDAAQYDYIVADNAALLELSGMTNNQRALVRATDHVWRYSGSAWVDEGLGPTAGKADKAALDDETAARTAADTAILDELTPLSATAPQGYEAELCGETDAETDGDGGIIERASASGAREFLEPLSPVAGLRVSDATMGDQRYLYPAGYEIELCAYADADIDDAGYVVSAMRDDGVTFEAFGVAQYDLAVAVLADYEAELCGYIDADIDAMGSITAGTRSDAKTLEVAGVPISGPSAPSGLTDSASDGAATLLVTRRDTAGKLQVWAEPHGTDGVPVQLSVSGNNWLPRLSADGTRAIWTTDVAGAPSNLLYAPVGGGVPRAVLPTSKGASIWSQFYGHLRPTAACCVAGPRGLSTYMRRPRRSQYRSMVRCRACRSDARGESDSSERHACSLHRVESPPS